MSRKKSNEYNFFLEGFASRLKTAREALGLSTLKIADIIGIKKNSYYKYEDGSRFPGPEILESILYKLNLNLNYLIAGTGPMFNRDYKNHLAEIIDKLPPETYPLIESLQIPIMKYSLMANYLVYKEKFKDLIRESPEQIPGNG
jgi:transcriptional regulator with XRE-family HTH domain